MKKKITPITLLSLTLGLAFDLLFYGKVPGVSVFLYSLLILGFTFYLGERFSAKISTSVYGLAAVIVFFAGMVFVRANAFLAVMNMFLVIFLLLSVVRLAMQPNLSLRQYRVSQYFHQIGGLPMRFIQEFFEAMHRTTRGRSGRLQKSSYAPVVRGLLISIPLLVVFSWLLASADLVFKKFVESLVDFDVPSELLVRTGLALFVASLFIGAFALIFIRTGAAEADPEPDAKKYGTTEAMVVLGSVGLLFLIFVLIQFAYFFGNSDHIISAGYTYAQYARKGFFELIAVATISLLLIWRIKLYTKFHTAQQTAAFKWMSGGLIAEVLIIMLSAHMRLNMYEEAYGFTTLRLLSHLFIGWLAVAFVLLLVYIVREERENQFAFQAFVSVLAFFALVNLINPDAFIARQNISRFNDTGKLDLYYLGNLSEDATPVIADLLDHSDQDLQKSAANVLYHQEGPARQRVLHWQSTNLARHRAIQIYDDKAAQIEAGKDHSDYEKFDAN